jgi:hypothetical protein
MKAKNCDLWNFINLTKSELDNSVFLSRVLSATPRCKFDSGT